MIQRLRRVRDPIDAGDGTRSIQYAHLHRLPRLTRMRQHHERTPTYSLVSIGPDARSAVGHRGQDDRQLSELQAARIIHFLKSHAPTARMLRGHAEGAVGQRSKQALQAVAPRVVPARWSPQALDVRFWARLWRPFCGSAHGCYGSKADSLHAWCGSLSPPNPG